MKYLLHAIFYPLVGLIISLASLAILAQLSVMITTKRFFASFAIGFTLSFIISSMDDDDIMKFVFRSKRDSPSYSDAKGRLKRGKKANTIITAVIDFISAALVVMEA